VETIWLGCELSTKPAQKRIVISAGRQLQQLAALTLKQDDPVRAGVTACACRSGHSTWVLIVPTFVVRVSLA